MLTAANGGKIAHEVLVKDESEKEWAKKKSSAIFFVIWIFPRRLLLLEAINFSNKIEIDTF